MFYIVFKYAFVHGSTNGTNGIPISFKVITMVPLVITLVPMVMPIVPFALPMVLLVLPMVLLVPLVCQWYHWLPMVPLVKLPMVTLGEPRTEPKSESSLHSLIACQWIGRQTL